MSHYRRVIQGPVRAYYGNICMTLVSGDIYRHTKIEPANVRTKTGVRNEIAVEMAYPTPDELQEFTSKLLEKLLLLQKPIHPRDVQQVEMELIDKRVKVTGWAIADEMGKSRSAVAKVLKELSTQNY